LWFTQGALGFIFPSLKKNYMKTNAHPIYALLLVIIMSAFSSCTNTSQDGTNSADKDRHTLSDTLVPANPVILHLCQYSVSTIVADTFYTAAVNGIKYGAEEFIISTHTLSIDYLNQVNADMEAAPPEGPAGSGFTPGFVITPVLVNTKKIIYLFQFCNFLCVDPVVGVSKPFTVEYVSNNYFMCTPDGKLSEYQNPITAIKQYTNHASFATASGTRPFDPTRDTRQIYAPIQKMIAMVKANSGQQGFKNAKGVKFLHYSNLVNDSLRQSVLFVPDNVTPQILKKAANDKNFNEKFLLVGSFGNAFANRSHLCPPSCNTLALTVSSPGSDNCQ
jgi:hypothetical protein